MKLSKLLLLIAMLSLPAAALSMQCAASSGERRIALLELYTSEGCDSCPPTDRWVSGLPARGLGLERLVVLGFHVDYWNYLGWPDPFAQKKFSERQHANSMRNQARFVYTPQLLLDGKDYRRGPLRDDIGDRIAAVNQRAPGATISMTLRPSSGDSLSVSGIVTVHDTATRDTAQTYLALYENTLSNRVTAGENRGKHLQHDFVVREFAGPFRAAASGKSDFSYSFRLDRNWKARDLFVAAFVQNGISGEVLQALAVPQCG